MRCPCEEQVPAIFVVRGEWGETKRRLSTTGKNAKKQLIPAWSTATASTKPLFKIKRLLYGCNRVTNVKVLRGGQRALRGFVTVRATEPRNTGNSALVAMVRHRRQHPTAL